MQGERYRVLRSEERSHHEQDYYENFGTDLLAEKEDEKKRDANPYNFVALSDDPNWD